jgi:hypothetical protein
MYRELEKLNSQKISDPMKKWANDLNRAFSKKDVQMAKNHMNRAFSKKDVQMAKNHMKKCSTFLLMEEMQIKITLRFYLTPGRMATIKNTNNKYWQGCGRKRNHHILLIGM